MKLVEDLRQAVEVRYAAHRRSRHLTGTKFIAVTGSSAKSTTASLLAFILEAHAPTASQLLNNTIRPIAACLYHMPRGRTFAVIEAGVGGKGNMAPIANLVKPDLVIVTMVSREHYSAFRTREAVAVEKGELVAALGGEGLAVLNADDPHVMSMAERCRGRVITFGREAGADYRAEVTGLSAETGLCLDVVWGSKRLSLQSRFLAEHFWLSCTAAAAVALELGVPEDLIVARIRNFPGVLNRFELYQPENGPRFILDTLKAPFDTFEMAFAALDALEAPRKRIVFGQLSDYPGSGKTKYRQVYRAALEHCDQVIFVGEHHQRARASPEEIANGRFAGFGDLTETIEYLRATAIPDELILLKSASNYHLERLALSFDHDIRCRVLSCGITGGCRSCGMFEHPFGTHASVRRRALLARLTGFGKVDRKPPAPR